MIYFELFYTFLMIGLFTFGGGYAMLPMIQAEVAAHGWLTNEELVNFTAVSECTPGPFAVNISTYIGMETGGILGALSATLGVILPSFVIILIVAKFYQRFKTSKYVKGCMSGLKPAVVGLIGAAAISIGQTVLVPSGLAAAISGREFYLSLLIFVITIGLSIKKVHPILLILISAAMGILAGYLFL